MKMKDGLPLDNAEEYKAWVDVFEAKARSKKIEDTEEGNALADEFPSNIGVRELIKVKQLVAPKDVLRIKWREIKECLEKSMEPKKRLLIAERTNFMQSKQEDMESIGEFAARLREQSVRCEFEKLKNDGADPAEILVKTRLIAGLLFMRQETRF